MSDSGAAAVPAADLTVQGKAPFGTEISVSAGQPTVHAVLDWCHGNPIEFALILVLIGWWVYQRRIGKGERARHKLEFDRERHDSKEAPVAQEDQTS